VGDLVSKQIGAIDEGQIQRVLAGRAYSRITINDGAAHKAGLSGNISATYLIGTSQTHLYEKT
jgi:hypothetical protein